MANSSPRPRRRPRFARIGRRLGVTRPSTTLIREVPVQLYVFDPPSVTAMTRDLSYLERREQLAHLALPSGPILLSPYYRAEFRCRARSKSPPSTNSTV